MKPRDMMIAAWCVLLFAMTAYAETPPPAQGDVGRYQLTISGGTMYIVDTTSGQCWSKTLDEPWADLGKPTEPAKRRVEKPLALDLPQEKVELTIKQRHSKAIPGSDERIVIYIDDVTTGQVVLSIHTDKGKVLQVLRDDVSVTPGDITSFEVDGKSFFVRVKELKNFLVGDDLAILQISADRKLLEREPKPKPADEPKENPPKKDPARGEDKADPVKSAPSN